MFHSHLTVYLYVVGYDSFVNVPFIFVWHFKITELDKKIHVILRCSIRLKFKNTHYIIVTILPLKNSIVRARGAWVISPAVKPI